MAKRPNPRRPAPAAPAAPLPAAPAAPPPAAQTPPPPTPRDLLRALDQIATEALQHAPPITRTLLAARFADIAHQLDHCLPPA